MEEQSQKVQTPKSGAKKWIILLVVAGVILLAGIGVGGYFVYDYFFRDDSKDVEQDEGEEKDGEEADKYSSPEEAEAYAALEKTVESIEKESEVDSEATDAIVSVSENIGGLGSLFGADTSGAGNSVGGIEEDVPLLKSMDQEDLTNSTCTLNFSVETGSDEMGLEGSADIYLTKESVSAEIDVDGNYEDIPVEGTMKMVVFDDMGYIRIDDVPKTTWVELFNYTLVSELSTTELTPEEQAYMDDIVATMGDIMDEYLVGKWISSPVEDDAEDDSQQEDSSDDAETEALEEAYMDLLSEENATYEGKENLHGEDAYNFSYDVTPEEFADFFEEVCDALGMTDCDTESIENGDITISALDLWINEDGNFRKFALEMVGEDGSAETSVALDFEIWAIGETESFPRPRNAVDMDELLDEMMEEIQSSY